MGLSNEVKESLLQAMDIIATNAASQVAFDTTIKCTIVDTSKASDGQYTVSDGSTKFIAYSENTLYKVNEYVRVLIPNGDFSGEKYIIGKCASGDDIEPITYVSAENSILEIVSLINEDRKIGLEANGETSSILINLPDISNISNITSNEIYSTLYMEISFQTQIEQLNMKSGTYGARLQIYDNSNNLIGVLDLNSSDFFGNPYSFKIPAKQSKKLNISGLNTISSFNLELYQKKDFTYIKNGQIKNLQTIGQNNIFITNIKIGIGTDLSLVEDNTVKIFTNDGLEYSSEVSSKEKHINLLWYNKTEDNTYIGFSDGIAKKNGVNNKDYDENNFLDLQKDSARLRSQLIDDVPVDEFGLSLRADVFLDSIPAIENIHTKIQKDLLKLLKDFEERIGLSCIPLKDIIYTTRESIATFLSGTEKTKGFEEEYIRISEIDYKKDMILTEKEYNNIKGISSGEEDFSVKFEKGENNKYKVLENITAILKQPINPIEYQFSNIFAYCSDCQKKVDNKEYSLPVRDIPTEKFYTQGSLTTTLQEIYNKISGKNKDGSMFESIEDLVDGDSALYPSFKGVWDGWKPSFEAIMSEIQTLASQVKLPASIEKSENKLTIKISEENSQTYSTNGYSYERWKDSFDYDSYNNLYSIYWYRYNPGYESTDDKIISKDWEKIITKETNLGLPDIRDTGDNILYWNKNSTGENIPYLSVELNSELDQEKFKVVIVYNHNCYESNELVFTNVNDLTHTTLENEDLIGFQIVHGENSVGNYQDYYNFTNELISSVESQRERTLIAKFQNANDNNEEILNTSSIYWYVPDGATMIKIDEKDLINNKGFSTDKYKTVEGYEEKEYSTNTDFTEERFLQVRQIYDVDKKEWVDYIPKHNLELNDNYYYYTRTDPEKGPLYKLKKNNEDIYKVRYCVSYPYYSYQIVDTNKKLSKDKKVIINNNITIDKIEYACIDVNTSKYVKKSDITLDTKNTIFYVKPNSFYYTNSTIKIKFYKDEVISKDDAATYYSNINFNDIATLKNNNYTINKDIEMDVQSLEKGSVIEDSFLFVSSLEEKVIIIFDEKNKRKQLQKLYGYVVDGKFIERSSLTIANLNLEKGICSTETAVYQYKMNKNNEINSKIKFVIESEFFDPLTKENYYKIWGQDNQFIKKSEYVYIPPYFSIDGYYCFYKKISNIDDRKFYYYIKDFFSQDATNNTIQCGIEGESWNLEETIRTLSLGFGTYGANGTEYSIRVNPTRRKENEKIITSLNITLYDGNGEVDFSQPSLYWIGPTSCLIQTRKKNSAGKGYIVEIVDRVGENSYPKDNYYALLKIVIDLKSISLESYYPVAYTKDIGYYIDGATSIVYDSLGTASRYCLDPYKIYSKTDNALSSLDNVTWDIQYITGLDGNPGENTSDINLTKYMPTLNVDGPILQPLNLYVDNVNCYATVICKQKEDIIWAQPIAILQNRFSSTTLNNWDGKLKIDEENNTILSAMIGAGRKNSDNSFSGVLMGDVAKADLSDSKIGLYGFHKGSQSFGFKVDGTAFLGKSGKGRIEFDGNCGIIKSALWNGTINKEGKITPGTQGMAISLEDGHIDAHDFKLTSKNIQLDSNPVDGGNWVNIGDENTYLRFTNTGKLDIRVTNFELTYHIGENLLVNTAPLENEGELLIYDNAWFSNKKSSLTDDYPFAIYDNKKNDWIQNYQFYPKNSTINNLQNIVFIKKSTSGIYDSFWTEGSKTLSPDDVLYILDDNGKSFSKAKDFCLHGDYLSESIYDKLSLNNWKSGWKVKPFFPTNSNWKDITKEVFKEYFKKGLLNTEKWFCKKSCWLFEPLQTGNKIITKSMFEKYFKYIDGEFSCLEDIHITTNIPSISETGNRYYSAQSSMYLDGKKRKSIILKDNIPLKQILRQSLKKDTNYTLSGQLLVAKEIKLLKVYMPPLINLSTSIDQDTYKNVLKIIFNEKEYKKDELFELNSEDNKYYIKITQSGMGILYYKDSTLKTDTIAFSLENEKKVIDSKSITWSNWGQWIDINLKFKTSSKELANIFKLEKTSNKNYDLYLYHLKLEEGLTATPWTQSTQEQNYADKVSQDTALEAMDYTNDLNDMLDSSSIFDRLTDYGNKQGFFTDDKTGKLFINAECIGVGLLRSNGVAGTFYYKNGPKSGVDLTEYENIAKEHEKNSQKLEITDIQLSAGTLFDMRSGIIAAHKFELNAWNDANQKGLYLNSDPKNLGAKKGWFLIGDNEAYLKFTSDNKLNIKVSEFSLGSEGKIDSDTYTTIGQQLTNYGIASKEFVTGQGYQTIDGVNKILADGLYISGNNKESFITTTYIFDQMAESKTNMYQTKNGKLYINAAAIQAGVLRSKNIEAIITDSAGNSCPIPPKVGSVSSVFENLVKENKTIDSIKLTKGTYFNLDTGSFLSADFNLDIQATNYNFVDGYEYTSADARMCLRNAAGIDSDAVTAKHIKDHRGTGKDSDLETVLYYYDVDKSGDISAGDARLILRKVAGLESLQKTRLTFNDSGLSFTTMVNTDKGKKPEEIFRVDAGGVYIKTLYKDESGGINKDKDIKPEEIETADYQRIFSHGTNAPGNTTTGYGTNGSVYFKIIS